MVYDVDDSYYHVSDIYTGDRSVYAKPETVAFSERVMRAADLITTTTPELAELYAHLGVPIVVLPNAVADEVLDWHLRTPPKRFTVGYQGSPSHLLDMQYWVSAFDGFMASRPQAQWHWFGINDPKCWPAHRQKVTPWINSPEAFHKSLDGRFHVGVAPLHPGLEFNRYKSGLKAQVYAALGRPTIASDTPYYRAVIDEGVTGWTVREASEWGTLLRHLADDPFQAEVMGMHARDLEATRTMSKVVHRWEQAYEEALCRTSS
jgi:glycosyltransferase involved in cell wall biosynthesis